MTVPAGLASRNFPLHFNFVTQHGDIDWKDAEEMLREKDSGRCYAVELDWKLLERIGRTDTQSSRQDHRPPETGTAMEEMKEPGRAAGRMSAKSPGINGVDIKGSVTPRPDDLLPRIVILEKQRQELLDINKKWDEYCQYLKRHYKQKIDKLWGRLAAWEHEHREGRAGTPPLDKPQNRNFDQSAELREAEKHVQCLTAQIAKLTTRGQQQTSEIQRLNRVLKESQEVLAVREEEVRVDLEVLRLQANTYKADFDLERRDRERLKERNIKLERRVAELFRQLQTFSSQSNGQQQATPIPTGCSSNPT
ncbi:TNFAIP3-interacting protein 1-like isoform X2 [Brienomyrus brachyistius]|uniref:TNFAIP3-interacting protein 1-like isoform X2 n=1 Tax=Brienomyrus brachyistius TaxID=42636 RepID=UPI0020B2E192|nr:TNFAIP3-interacting protein 1-like isoform X2 [Brienomyrus brachyistius]